MTLAYTLRFILWASTALPAPLRYMDLLGLKNERGARQSNMGCWLTSDRSDIVQYRVITSSVTPHRVKPGISQVGHSPSCEATNHVSIYMFISPDQRYNEEKNAVVLVESPKVPCCASLTGTKLATQITILSQLKPRVV
jgi:hypothetical protein